MPMTAKQRYHFLCSGQYDPSGGFDVDTYCEDLQDSLNQLILGSYNVHSRHKEFVLDRHELLHFDIIIRVVQGLGSDDWFEPDFVTGGLFFLDFNFDYDEVGDSDERSPRTEVCEFGITLPLALLAALDTWCVLLTDGVSIHHISDIRLIISRLAQFITERGDTC